MSDFNTSASVEKLQKIMEKAYPLFKKHDKQMAVFLHQSINKYADEESLKRIIADIDHFLDYLEDKKL